MRLILGWAVAAALLVGACASHERFPDAPILLVCPWAAGGGSDRVAREVGALLERDLNVPVNVVNVTGGDGVTGHSRGALARPDGYTMTLVTVEIATLHWRRMTSISYRDFSPIALVNRDSAAIFVRADAPWQTLKDLEDAVRSAPRSLRASGTATAGIWHLGLAGWLDAVGLSPTDVTWVSIGGSAPSLQELIAGGIDFVVCSLPEARALLDANRIRALAVMADERVPQFPSVPTLAEQGIDFSLGTIRGLAVPRDVPPERRQVLVDAVTRVVQGQAYRTAMSRAGFTPAYEDPARFSRTLEQTDVRLGALLDSDAFRGIAVATIGPMFFPAALGVALVGVTLGLLVTGRRVPTGHDVSGGVSAGWWRFLEPPLWIGLYILLAEPIGFVLTAGALLLLYLLRLGTRLTTATMITVVLVPTTYYVFAGWLRVPLPRGILGW